MEPETDKSLRKFLTSSEPMKKITTQLFLSLSIFSFVYSYYSLQSSPLFSANPFNLQSQSVNKNYIFLICNAILVLLSKTSSLVRSSSGFDLNDMLQKRVGDGLLTYNSFETKEPPFLQKLKEDEEDERILNGDSDYNFEADAEINEKESENCLIVDDIIEEEEGGFMDEQEVAEEEVLSREELNKKCEEFIRKTKEEIMINEARQLVIVK